MKIKRSIIIGLLVLIPMCIQAQRMNIEEGSFKNLKGISSFLLKFDYTAVQIPKYDSEEEFLKDKMAKREEKEAGTGDKFKKSWFDDRKNRYEPKFEESFLKRFPSGKLKVGTALSDATHTMKIHTTKLYPGYNVGVWRQNSEIDATITILDNQDQVLLVVSYKNVQGAGAMGFDYDSGYRISECYAKLAKEFAKMIKKKAK